MWFSNSQIFFLISRLNSCFYRKFNNLWSWSGFNPLPPHYCCPSTINHHPRCFHCTELQVSARYVTHRSVPIRGNFPDPAQLFFKIFTSKPPNRNPQVREYLHELRHSHKLRPGLRFHREHINRRKTINEILSAVPIVVRSLGVRENVVNGRFLRLIWNYHLYVPFAFARALNTAIGDFLRRRER